VDIKRRGFLKIMGAGAATAPTLLKSLTAKAVPVETNPREIKGFKRTLVRTPITDPDLVRLSIDRRRKWIRIDSDFVEFLPVHRKLAAMCEEPLRHRSNCTLDVTDAMPTERVAGLNLYVMKDGWRIVNPERMRGAEHFKTEWIDIWGVDEDDETMVHFRCEKCPKHGSTWHFMPYTSMQMCKHTVEFKGVDRYGMGLKFPLLSKHDAKRLMCVAAIRGGGVKLV
jgi:hypothetical protein